MFVGVTTEGQALYWNQGPKPFQMIHDTHHSTEELRHCVQQYVSPLVVGDIKGRRGALCMVLL